MGSGVTRRDILKAGAAFGPALLLGRCAMPKAGRTAAAGGARRPGTGRLWGSLGCDCFAF